MQVIFFVDESGRSVNTVIKETKMSRMSATKINSIGGAHGKEKSCKKSY
jgi:hypothetical protein